MMSGSVIPVGFATVIDERNFFRFGFCVWLNKSGHQDLSKSFKT